MPTLLLEASTLVIQKPHPEILGLALPSLPPPLRAQATPSHGYLHPMWSKPIVGSCFLKFLFALPRSLSQIQELMFLWGLESNQE